MSTIRSALDELRAEELAWVNDDGLEADFAELERAADVLHAERLRRLAEIERRGSYRRNGYLSLTSWLAQRFRVAWSAACQQVRAARALEQMADGGETALPNLTLLCRPHHRLVHRGFRVDVADGKPVFFRPDGSPLEDHGPP